MRVEVEEGPIAGSPIVFEVNGDWEIDRLTKLLDFEIWHPKLQPKFLATLSVL